MQHLQFPEHGISLVFSGEVTFLHNGEACTLKAGEEGCGLRTDYTVGQDGHFASVCLRITNTGREPVRVLRTEVLQMTGSALQTGVSWDESCVLILGRHKNDIPSLVTLGRMDDAMADALDGMTESGDRAQGDGEGRCLTSDTLTLLKGKKGWMSFSYPDGSKYFCHTRFALDGSQKITSGCEVDVVLAPGGTLEAEKLVLEVSDRWEELAGHFAQSKAAMLGTRKNRLPRPDVYCTWYYYGLTVSLEDVRENLRAIVSKKLPYNTFQIDEGWETTLGEWRPNPRFPVSMKELAGEIRAAGMTPGIWTSPFISHETASIWKEHPEWRLCANGVPVLFPMNGTVYQVLDITIPRVREWITSFYRMLTVEWGYTYHKLDFTRAAVIYPEAERYDASMSWPQAYRLAMQAVGGA